MQPDQSSEPTPTVRSFPGEVYAEVYHAAPDGIVVANQGGTICYVNPQAVALFAYPEEELVGLCVEDLIPEAHRRGHEGHRARYAESPSRRAMNAGMALYGRRKDGTVFPAEISLSPCQLQGEFHVIAIVRDVTEAVRMRAFSAGTLRAAENERKRIAQELHDDTAQRLAAIKMRLKSVSSGSLDDHQSVCDEIREEVGNIATGISQIARGLRPPELDQVGVAAAIRSWLDQRKGGGGLRGTVEADAVDQHLDPDQRLVLYRVVQEAVSNVVRHAKASRVDVRIRNEDGVIVTHVVDDGMGFDTGAVGRAATGLGLLGMRERASMVGALIAVASAPGQGTRVRMVMNAKPSSSAEMADS